MTFPTATTQKPTSGVDMRNKLLFVTGIGIGYVFGTRAGRERYEQIRRTAAKVKENPTFQEAAGALQAQAGGLVSTAKDTVNDKLGNTAIGAKVTNFLGTTGSSAPTEVTPGPAGTPATPTPIARPAGSNGVTP
jgi:hypothetical protein